jgi:hypothetical protein
MVDRCALASRDDRAARDSQMRMTDWSFASLIWGSRLDGPARPAHAFSRTAIVRAEESITLAEQRVTQAQQERRRVETKDLEKTRDEIADARAKLVTATQLLHEAQTSAPAEARERLSQNDGRANFTILRRDGETMREVVADETTLVAPDDVIKIPTVRLPPVARGAFLSLSRAGSPER